MVNPGTPHDPPASSFGLNNTGNSKNQLQIQAPGGGTMQQIKLRSSMALDSVQEQQNDGYVYGAAVSCTNNNTKSNHL